MKYQHSIMNSPIGALKLVANQDGLVAVLWPKDRPDRVRLGTSRHAPESPVLRLADEQLHEYFANTRTEFSVPLAPFGTAFQKEVWMALRAIPFGETRSYGEIAQQIGRPSAARAVGAANGKNPISIIVPCHRVIGSSGKLTGFAGGLQAKAYLLSLEK